MFRWVDLSGIIPGCNTDLKILNDKSFYFQNQCKIFERNYLVFLPFFHNNDKIENTK